jgi:hypothetical protein
MKAAPQTIVAGRMIRFYIGQSLSKTVPSTQMAARRYEIWMSYHWKKMPPVALQLPYAMQIDVDLLTYLPQERNVESDPQVLALPDLAPLDHCDREFNVNQAAWLAISEPVRAIGQQDIKGWIVGGAVAAACWILGGFTALVISALALAALNSIVLVFSDIKQGQFGATRTLADLVQFAVFMGFIALGRFADYGISADRIIIVRSFMLSLVIAVCFWRSFRGLVLLADMEGLDDLIEQQIDLVVNWINQTRRRRRDRTS